MTFRSVCNQTHQFTLSEPRKRHDTTSPWMPHEDLSGEYNANANHCRSSRPLWHQVLENYSTFTGKVSLGNRKIITWQPCEIFSFAKTWCITVHSHVKFIWWHVMNPAMLWFKHDEWVTARHVDTQSYRLRCCKFSGFNLTASHRYARICNTF